MRLTKTIEALDLSLKIDDALIIADIHMGFEEALNKQGVFIPRTQFQETSKRLEKILKQTKPKTVIINGDLKHEFGTISDQEWRHTLKFLDFLSRHCEKVILIRGNHDTILEPIAKKRGIEIHDSYFLDDFGALVCHGDKLPSPALLKKSTVIIIGHEHPSIALRSGKRVEKYKCFYLGSYQGKKLIVLPSLNLLTEGSALMHEDALSPFLRQDISDFEAFAVEDKVYRFGKLKNLGHF